MNKVGCSQVEPCQWEREENARQEIVEKLKSNLNSSG